MVTIALPSVKEDENQVSFPRKRIRFNDKRSGAAGNLPGVCLRVGIWWAHNKRREK